MEQNKTNPTSSKQVSPNEEPAKSTNPQAKQEMFAPVIFTYTRKQALADGVQVEVSKIAREAGFKIPVFLTHSVYDQYVKIPEGVTCQDEEGRLWDIVWMLRCAVGGKRSDCHALEFELYVRNSNDKPAELVTLAAQVEAMDFDDPNPAITISLPGED
jgi:hypothetical protein